MWSIPASVLILTYNEEANLPRCLESLKWCDDVSVLDSYSNDKTEAIASEYGVKFYQRAFDDYSSQRNYGLNEIQHDYPWVLMVDADEEVPLELVSEIKLAINDCDGDVSLFRMRRKDFFLGRWIKRSSGYPTWFGRLVKVGHARVERSVNEEFVTDGKVGLLQKHLHHYPFNKGFAAWFEKHNRYSSMEANIISGEGIRDLYWPSFFSADPVKRRKAVKNLVYRMPFRPFMVFFALYVFRGGFLDGRAGLTFCFLRSFYEFMINCKVKELRMKKRGIPL